MKLFKNLLPALGLVFGATLAMAMNFAEPMPDQVYARDPSNPSQFIDVTDWEPGVDYNCNATGDCLYDAPNGNVIQSGTFTEL